MKLFDIEPYTSTKRITIYVLELENQKFYIGQTSNFNSRLKFHLKGKQGADWTKKHKPLGVIEKIDTDFYSVQEAMGIENEVTLKYMKLYGWRNVRGGDFCTLEEKKLRFLLTLHSKLGDELINIQNPKKFNLNKEKSCLYVLKLSGGNYFVGRTNKLKLAILNEYNGLGSEWTKLHKPLELFNVIEIDIEDKVRLRKLHNNYVISYMKKFGFQKIRGGDFFKTDLRNHKNKVLNYTDIFKNKL